MRNGTWLIRKSDIIYETWLIRIWDMGHDSSAYEKWDVTQSHMRNETWLVRTSDIVLWDMTHSHMRNDSFIYEIWLICISVYIWCLIYEWVRTKYVYMMSHIWMRTYQVYPVWTWMIHGTHKCVMVHTYAHTRTHTHPRTHMNESWHTYKRVMAYTHSHTHTHTSGAALVLVALRDYLIPRKMLQCVAAYCSVLQRVAVCWTHTQERLRWR